MGLMWQRDCQGEGLMCSHRGLTFAGFRGAQAGCQPDGQICPAAAGPPLLPQAARAWDKTAIQYRGE